jgi:hypothetical protein
MSKKAKRVDEDLILEERRLRRVSKDEGPTVASWFETAQERLLTIRIEHSTPQNMQPGMAVFSLALSLSG